MFQPIGTTIQHKLIGLIRFFAQWKHPSIKIASTIDDDVNMERSSKTKASSSSSKWFDLAEEIPLFDWRDLEANVEAVLQTCNSNDSDGEAGGTCGFQNESS